MKYFQWGKNTRILNPISGLTVSICVTKVKDAYCKELREKREMWRKLVEELYDEPSTPRLHKRIRDLKNLRDESMTLQLAIIDAKSFEDLEKLMPYDFYIEELTEDKFKSIVK